MVEVRRASGRQPRFFGVLDFLQVKWAANGLESFSGNLCAVLGRDVDLNLTKMDCQGPYFFLLRQNISYTPIVWNACGRAHQETLTVSRSLSKSIARIRTFVSAEVVYQRLHSSITLERLKRYARLILSLLLWTLTFGLLLEHLRSLLLLLLLCEHLVALRVWFSVVAWQFSVSRVTAVCRDLARMPGLPLPCLALTSFGNWQRSLSP